MAKSYIVSITYQTVLECSLGLSLFFGCKEDFNHYTEDVIFIVCEVPTTCTLKEGKRKGKDFFN